MGGELKPFAKPTQQQVRVFSSAITHLAHDTLRASMDPENGLMMIEREEKGMGFFILIDRNGMPACMWH